MKEESQNNEVENRESISDAPNETRDREVDSSRRTLARAGMAAPILMSLASRPVLATPLPGGGGCLSGQISGNVSQQDHWENSCAVATGCPPQFWKDNPALWPAGFSAGSCVPSGANPCKQWDPAADTASATTFSEVFLGIPSMLFSGYEASLMEVMQQDRNSLDAHAAAAVLNSAYLGSAAFGESVARIVEAYYKVSNGEATETWLLDILSAMNSGSDCPATTTCSANWTFLRGSTDPDGDCHPVNQPQP